MRAVIVSMPLFWRVFATTAAVLVLATLGLIFAAVTVSIPVSLTELVVLLGGLAAMLALTLFYWRRPAT